MSSTTAYRDSCPRALRCSGVCAALPVLDEAYQLRDLERFAEEPAPERQQRSERLGIGAASHERDPRCEARVVDLTRERTDAATESAGVHDSTA